MKFTNFHEQVSLKINKTHLDYVNLKLDDRTNSMKF
jgi:hypothetical protein